MFKLNKSQTPAKPVETPAQMLKRVEAELTAARLRDQYAEERSIKTAELEAQRAEILSGEIVTHQTIKSERRDAFRSNLINFGPLVVINGLAVVGQYGWFAENLSDTFGNFGSYMVAVFAAGALESIALFLGYHAMKALRRKDSAAGLLFASVVIAAVVATMNYTHFAGEELTPTTAAVAFGLFSFVAPFLWRVKIRSDHRDELAANGEIDRRGLKLERSRIVWHPIKSVKVIRHAAWTGQRDPDLAVKEWEASKTDTTDLRMELAIMEAHERNREFDASQNGQLPATVRRALPSSNGDYPTHHPKWAEAVATYAASYDSGEPMKVKDLAEYLGMANRVVAGKAREYVLNQRGVKRDDNDGSDLTSETA